MQTNQQTIEALETAIKEAQETLAQLKEVPEQTLATTMKQVVEILKPDWVNTKTGQVDQTSKPNIACVTSAAAAEKVQAYTDILNLCHYLNSKFYPEECKYYFISNNFNILYNLNGVSISPIYHFTSLAAAEYALRHFKGVFEKFYQTL